MDKIKSLKEIIEKFLIKDLSQYQQNEKAFCKHISEKFPKDFSTITQFVDQKK
jgi:hypothetical protein